MKKILLGATALIATVGAVFANGAFQGYPITGVPDSTVCLSFGNNGVCNQYAPVGPAVSSESWLVPADTGSNTGRQTVNIPAGILGSINPRINRLIGGDFGTNLWQRGATPVSAASPSTTVMGADRWAVYSSGNVVTVSRQTAAADTIPTLGFYASQRTSRPSGTNTSAICTGQILDKQAAAPLIGNNAIFSFYALAGAGLSAVSGNNITATIAYYTAADSATPGTNTDTFMKGTITGYQAVSTGGGLVNVVGNAVGNAVNNLVISSGVATVPITTSWSRFSVYGRIPATNAAGTAVTGVGVTLCYTPTSGTGGSTEWFEFTGAQLQAASSAVTAYLPAGITEPSGFERRSPQFETDLQYYYSQVLTDGAATLRYGLGQATTTGSASVVLALSPMRIAPATTVATATSFGVTVAAGTAATCTTLAAIATSNTTNTAGLTCATGGTLAAGNAVQFIGAATGALLTFSAEP